MHSDHLHPYAQVNPSRSDYNTILYDKVDLKWGYPYI